MARTDEDGTMVISGEYATSGLADGFPSVERLTSGFEELRAKMNGFTLQFDQFLVAQNEQVLQERNEHARTLAEDKETYKSVHAHIEESKAKQAEYAAALEMERAEVSEAERSVAEFTDKKNEMLSRRAVAEKRIETLRAAIAQIRDQKLKQRNDTALQASRNLPELQFWEHHLAMRIEGIREDMLKIIFTCIDENDWSREFYFCLDLSERDYKVPLCEPLIPQIADLVGRLNKSREFYAFLGWMRDAFKASV